MIASPRILIVEDNLVQRDVLHLIVSRYVPTAIVTAVSTGYDALVAYQASGADLLILDHVLPDVLGATLLQYLRETGVMTPTIVVSGVLTREDVPSDAHTLFLHKPLLVPEFVATLTQVLGTSGGTLTA